MPIARPKVRFQKGGALAAGNTLYIRREADDALTDALVEGQYCLVFAPRQVGKSSLRARVEARLREDHQVGTARVDLSAIGLSADLEAWYYSLVREIAESLDLTQDMAEFWTKSAGIASPVRFQWFLRDIVLRKIAGAVVIFVDEVDLTLALSDEARDDFFAAIRWMFNARSDNAPLWSRLRFCLIGVMIRDDLSTGHARTPFNIECKEIRLEDFTREEIDAFRAGLPCNADVILDRIFWWTNGHPALSQSLCGEIASRVSAEGDAATVDGLVQTLYLGKQHEINPVLGDTARRFHRDRKDPLLVKILLTYKRLLEGERMLVGEVGRGVDGLRMLTQMRIAGLTTEKLDGHLAVRNRIVEQVFDLEWVKRALAEKYFADDFRRWIDGGKVTSDLLVGKQLQEAMAWLEEQRDISDEERDFVFESESTRSRRHKLIGVVILLLLTFITITIIYYLKVKEKEKALESVAQQQEREKLGAEAFRLSREPGKSLGALERGIRAVHTPELPFSASLGLTEALKVVCEKRILTGHRMPARTVEFSPDSSYIVASLDVSARLWSAFDGKLIGELPHDGRMQYAAFSPNGSSIVTASSDGEVKLWHVPNGLEQRRFTDGHRKKVYMAVFSPNDRYIATASADATARLWTVATGESIVLRHGEKVWALAFSPDGKYLATASADGTAGIWSGTTGNSVVTLKGAEGESQVQIVVFSHDGNRVVTATTGPEVNVRLWNAHEFGEESSGQSLIPARELLRKSHAELTSVLFSPKDNYIMTTWYDGTISAWSVDGEEWFSKQVHEGAILGAVFSPNGAYIITGGNDGYARLWSVVTAADGRVRLDDSSVSEYNHGEDVYAVAFSPNGERIATASNDVWLDWTPQTKVALENLPQGPSREYMHPDLLPDLLRACSILGKYASSLEFAETKMICAQIGVLLPIPVRETGDG